MVLRTSTSRTGSAQGRTFIDWDALIIEAARRVGAARVVTEDLQSGRRFGSVIVENPFQTM